jgi:hypothetical protein
MGNCEKKTMKLMNIKLIIIILTIPFSRTFATSQIPDRIIYNGDTVYTYSNPLELLYSNDSIRPKFFVEKQGCLSTDCYRGYQAEWTIKDNQLFLTGIYSCCFSEDKIKADLHQLFGEKYINGKVKADWVSGNMIASGGKFLFYFSMDQKSVFETDIEFQFQEGLLIGSKTYDNSKSHLSEYSKDQMKLGKYIYSNINWNTLPNLNQKKITVYVRFSSSENGIIDSVNILRSDDNNFNNEAIRVIKSIPEWDVIYGLGKHERKPFILPIAFSEENRKRYNK